MDSDSAKATHRDRVGRRDAVVQGHVLDDAGVVLAQDGIDLVAVPVGVTELEGGLRSLACPDTQHTRSTHVCVSVRTLHPAGRREQNDARSGASFLNEAGSWKRMGPSLDPSPSLRVKKNCFARHIPSD